MNYRDMQKKCTAMKKAGVIPKHVRCNSKTAELKNTLEKYSKQSPKKASVKTSPKKALSIKKAVAIKSPKILREKPEVGEKVHWVEHFAKEDVRQHWGIVIQQRKNWVDIQEVEQEDVSYETYKRYSETIKKPIWDKRKKEFAMGKFNGQCWSVKHDCLDQYIEGQTGKNITSLY
jgi:hypothetical protein